MFFRQKSFAIFLVICSTTCCMAKDLFLIPEKILTADTFVSGGITYKIDGIEPPSGAWGEIAKKTMEQMIKGKEFKFLYFSIRSRKKGKTIYHVYFGIYGRDGKSQPNASVKLLMMGLAKFSKGCVDDNRGKPYRPAEKYARQNGLGIWCK